MPASPIMEMLQQTLVASGIPPDSQAQLLLTASISCETDATTRTYLYHPQPFCVDLSSNSMHSYHQSFQVVSFVPDLICHVPSNNNFLINEILRMTRKFKRAQVYEYHFGRSGAIRVIDLYLKRTRAAR